jgi:ferredoxin-NADP reductase
MRLANALPALEVDYTLTRSQPPGWTGYASRVDGPMLAATAWPPANEPLCYVCGPTGFVETVAVTLVDKGHDPQRIKTERFGPTRG